MKFFLYLAFFFTAAVLSASESMTVMRSSNDRIYMRSSWNETHDLFRVCGLGGNKQFNCSYTSLVGKKHSDHDMMVKRRYFGRFHWCGDSTGVMHPYPWPDRKNIFILSGSKVSVSGNYGRIVLEVK